ncbi:SigE family RNA polymerase sigma factor [Rhodococcus oryzae]|uniref:SigE family RNA polymerase sigma factor n=1 Tax=Rhodococcus oryzae TaxID=2571143 RepID=UPI003712657B
MGTDMDVGPASNAGSGRGIEYEDFVRQKRSGMLRSATLLAGGDTHLAEDLVQITLVRLYLKWPRARKMNVEAYARKILVNNLIDHYRRPFMRRERNTGDIPDVVVTSADWSAAGVAGFVDDHLVAALAALPPRMRAAVVLRYVEELNVEETARALRCSTGTVKSQSSRGLEKLRSQLETPAAVNVLTAPTELARPY